MPLVEQVKGLGAAGEVEAFDAPDGMPTVYVPVERLVDLCRALRDTPELRFAVLLDVVAIDLFPREPRFELSYLLLSPGAGGYGSTPQRLRVKVRVSGADPRVPSVSGVWTAANWAEREAFDFYGITFDGHPDPSRILMPEDWIGHPLRKDYEIGEIPVQFKGAPA